MENNSLLRYNPHGQSLLSYSIKGEALIRLDVAHLSSGIYYITHDKFNIEPLKFLKTT